MAFAFDCIALTHIGKRRKNNEDNFYIGDLLEREEQRAMSQTNVKAVQKVTMNSGAAHMIFAISDGMGGCEDGEIASYIAVDSIKKFVGAHRQRSSRRHEDKYEYVREFQELIGQINTDILEYAAANNKYDNVGTTLCGLIAFADEIVPFNIGDSSAFLFEGGQMAKLTTDDNERSIFLCEDSQHWPDQGKRLTKYCGLPLSGGVMSAAMSTPVLLRPGQIYMIASDGLTDSVSLDDISRVLGESAGSMEEDAAELLSYALNSSNGGSDNITIVLIKVIKSIKKKEL